MTERRANHRYSLALPIAIRRDSTLTSALHGEIRDISAQGLYFTTRAPLEPGATFEFRLELPGEVTGNVTVLIVAQATSVRIAMKHQGGTELFSVGAVIEKLEIMRAAAAPAGTQGSNSPR